MPVCQTAVSLNLLELTPLACCSLNLPDLITTGIDVLASEAGGGIVRRSLPEATLAATTVTQVVTLPILAGLLVLLILLMGLLAIRFSARPSRQRSQTNMARPAEEEESGPPEIPSTPPAQKISPDAPTAPLVPFPESLWREPGTTQPSNNVSRIVPTPEEILKKENEGDSAAAAKMWGRLARWEDAARCYEKAGNMIQAACIYNALDQYDRALPLLRQVLDSSPMDGFVRLALVEILLNQGKPSEALEAIEAMSGENGRGKAKAEFFAGAASQLESAELFQQAEAFYRKALEIDDRLADVQMRLVFLSQIKRLQLDEPAPGGSHHTPQSFLDRFMKDTSELEDFDPISSDAKPKPLRGHEIIVGHIALGFQRKEPPASVDSVYSLSKRFVLEELVSESNRCAVFRANDRLLDFPVALKLYRLPDGFPDMESLAQRFLAIAHLNHPNLAKLTFVDREGSILRMATEYLPGGNLNDFLKKLGGVGLPLIIRMALHVASALHTAHLHGVPHGDVRPENMILGTDQRLKLVDFVLAPIPVIPTKDDSHESVPGLNGPNREHRFIMEAIKSDILQFGQVLSFMLEHSRRTSDPVAVPGAADAAEELHELVARIEKGSFLSIYRLCQILQQIFERTLPVPSGRSENPRLNL